MNVYEHEAPRIRRNMARIRAMTKFLQRLPDLPGVEPYASADTMSVYIHIPFSPPALLAMRRAMGRGWKLRRCTTYSNDTQNIQRAYGKEGEEFEIAVCMSTAMEGATCQRVQVGERVVPVYEVHCN